MATRSRFLLALRLAAAGATALAAWLAFAAEPAMPRDPWVPPAARSQAAAEHAKPTQGTALAAQVERKLHASFQAADSAGTGRITREQARAAGLGTVAEHFDRIDAQHTGTVSFDEVRRYLKSQGARNL